jgi:hypothetical protein
MGLIAMPACTGRAARFGQFAVEDAPGSKAADRDQPSPTASKRSAMQLEESKVGWTDNVQGAYAGQEMGSDPILGSRMMLPGSISRVEPGGAQSAPPAAASRMMVYSSWFTIVVHETQAAVAEAERIADEFGGYVERIQGHIITMRVPADRYAEAIAQLETLGQVADRRMQAEDKTDEFVDIEARLKNAKAVHGRLTELLAKAENVEAALAVELELKRIGEEIERLTAALETLRKRIALGTITVTFQTVARQPQTAPLGRLPFNWLRELHPTSLLRN